MQSDRTVITKTLTMNDAGNLLALIHEKKLEALPAILAVIKNATANHHYFIFLEKATRAYARICAAIPPDEAYEFLTDYVKPLRTLSDTFAHCIDDALEEGGLSKQEANKLAQNPISIHQSIIKNAILVFTAQLPLHLKPNNSTCVAVALNSLYELCFVRDEDYAIDESIDVTIQAVHQCIDSISRYMIAHVNPDWVKSVRQRNALTEAQTELTLLLIALEGNGVSESSLDISRELCREAKNKTRALIIPNTSSTALTFSTADAGIPKEKHLSQVRAIISDYDDTVEILALKTIPGHVVEQFKILHHTLNIPTYILTARNDEMDHQEHHFKPHENEDNVIFVSPKKESAIPATIAKHGLDTVIPRDNVFYCNFYSKIPVKDNPAYPYYFCYTAQSKKTKMDDFLIAIKKLKLNPAHVAVFDDNEMFWQNIKSYTKNFFHINNGCAQRNLKTRLNALITQLILHGEHIPLCNRLLAAQEATRQHGILNNSHRERAALQKFINDHQQSQEEKALPTHSY